MRPQDRLDRRTAPGSLRPENEEIEIVVADADRQAQSAQPPVLPDKCRHATRHSGDTLQHFRIAALSQSLHRQRLRRFGLHRGSPTFPVVHPYKPCVNGTLISVKVRRIGSP